MKPACSIQLCVLPTTDLVKKRLRSSTKNQGADN